METCKVTSKIANFATRICADPRPKRRLRTLYELKKLGIRISLDDFGTGHSSLSYLKSFPIDTLKIDQSFVHDVTTDPDTAAIVTAIIAMAHSLRLKVIAEGVEFADQAAFLKEHGCAGDSDRSPRRRRGCVAHRRTGARARCAPPSRGCS